MADQMLVYVGTYTEPIRFGTGKVLEGKGEGIYLYRMHPTTGALVLDSTTPGVVNPSYLAFDPAQRFLYAVNELKTYNDQPTGTISAFTVDRATGKLAIPEHAADARDGPLSRGRGRQGPIRLRRQLHERECLRAAGAQRW